MTVAKYFFCGLLAMSASLFSVSASAHVTHVKHSVKVSRNHRVTLLKRAKVSSAPVGRILNAFNHWRGVRYLWGGTTRHGIDCSAFTRAVFAESYHIHLPRTTFQQIRMGKQVAKKNLAPGDLIFFNMKPGVRHVGIYIGNNRFIHSSLSKGVTVSSFARPYWQQHFMAARRVIGH